MSFSNRQSRGRGKTRFSHNANNWRKPRGNRSAGRGGRSQSQFIDPSLFVRKTEEVVVMETRETPTGSFEEMQLIDLMRKNIRSRGFVCPTPIQAKAIQPIVQGSDVIGIANTGSGKTAAFLIPLLNKLYQQDGQKALIVVPTRELAMQIAEEFHALSSGMRLGLALCIGGMSMRRQEDALSYLPRMVIGTPGRLKDLINREILNLNKFNNIVLDEVDRMVDIGFLKDIEYLISFLPTKRQSLFFSATVNSKTEQILKRFVDNPVTVSVKQQETSANVDQDIVKVTYGANKVDILHDLLIGEEFKKVLVFGRTKWGVEKLSKELIHRGFRAASIHGNKTQGQRQRALTQFKRNDIQVLLATDVASRGIDIDDITHVINFDQPATYDDYVHRIGRTGRAGKMGKALTFVE